MKKFYPLLLLLVVAAVAGLYGLDYYRELRAHQREQAAHLVARCVNQGLLSLFSLQANDWRRRPDFQREQGRKLEETVAQLPQQLLDGEPFAEWQDAIHICDRLTRHSNLQHKTIFGPLGDFVSPVMSDSRTLKNRDSLARRHRTINHLQVSAQAAARYLDDLRADIQNQLNESGLSGKSRALVASEINTQVLDYYRLGKFSVRQVSAHLQRVERYYNLLADNPRAFTLRAGSLFFHDRALRRQVDNLNSAILQGEVEFLVNWSQIVERQQSGIGAI